MRQVVQGAKGGSVLTHGSRLIVNMDCSDTSEKTTGQHHRPVEKERNMRREIANSNERRRMQSINTGFQSLRSMLPHTDGGEKLSKAAVLQQAADYMHTLLEERKALLADNADFRKLRDSRSSDHHTPVKRCKRDTESSDEGIGLSYSGHLDADTIDDLRRDVVDLRLQLEQAQQRNSYLEQYAYNLLAAQSVVAPPALQQMAHRMSVGELQPRAMELRSTEEEMHRGRSASSLQSNEFADYQVRGPAKESSMASRNLSIIVEAINHLEGDSQHGSQHSGKICAAEKEVDSGVSLGESSDDTKSDCSGADTPQPPPAHQTPYCHQMGLFSSPSLMYRPAYVNQLSNGVIISPHHH